MTTTVHVAYALTGGGATALDYIDGSGLADGDLAMVFASSVAYLYLLDDDSAAAESSPDVISPDANAGDKRWVLQGAFRNTLTADLACADYTLTRPKFKDYGEVVNAIGSVGGGAQAIDLELGNVVTATVDTSETTFSFTNPSASGTACSFTLILTNGGSQTVNWPASVDWAGGTAPTLTASGVDILGFLTVDGGTTWYGFEGGINFS